MLRIGITHPDQEIVQTLGGTEFPDLFDQPVGNERAGKPLPDQIIVQPPASGGRKLRARLPDRECGHFLHSRNGIPQCLGEQPEGARILETAIGQKRAFPHQGVCVAGCRNQLTVMHGPPVLDAKNCLDFVTPHSRAFLLIALGVDENEGDKNGKQQQGGFHGWSFRSGDGSQERSEKPFQPQAWPAYPDRRTQCG